MRPRPVIEPATPEDIEQFATGRAYPTLKAWVARVDGELVALFGLARNFDGRWYAFFDITEAARPYKVTIVRNARMVMDAARRMGLSYVYVFPDSDEPLAAKWMQRLGFEPDPRMNGRMRWNNDG